MGRNIKRWSTGVKSGPKKARESQLVQARTIRLRILDCGARIGLLLHLLVLDCLKPQAATHTTTTTAHNNRDHDHVILLDGHPVRSLCGAVLMPKT